MKNNQRLCDSFKKEGGINFTIQTTDNACIRGTFFDRKSNFLLVIGPGFPTPREKMAPFIHLFPNYDVVLFDYRGQGLDYPAQWGWNPFQVLGRLTYALFGIDMNITGIGTIEATDVMAVVHAMKAKKNYSQVFGLGLCYSSFIFAQAAAANRSLFDKLIFDGSWPSLKRVIKKIAQEPSLICGRQPPSSPCTWLTHKTSFQEYACNLIQWATNINVDQAAPLNDYLAKLAIPILFFQCINDCYCSSEEFETLWLATQSSRKTAVFTHNLHGRNYLWQKEMYAYLCHAFLENDHDIFVRRLNVSSQL